jgi:mycothiol synthase
MRDIESVTALIRACEEVDEGDPEMTADDLRAQWSRARFDLQVDAWIVVRSERRIAGYVDVWDRQEGERFVADGYVHPDLRGHGVGTYLVRMAETRARERASARGSTVSHTIFHGDEGAHRLFVSEGYTVVQNYWRMVIDPALVSTAADPPTGVRTRSFVPGQDETAVWELVQEAFADNAGYGALPFAEWASFMLERESFDPSTYFVAEAGGEITGVALCPNYGGRGWVRQLAVRRQWRRRGVGRALMLAAFSHFRRLGYRQVGLVVDSYNRTGAREFYESLGMRVERQHDRHEKGLTVSR